MATATITPTTRILPLSSEQADLALVGGKGANLARLARAGFPVPGGFLATTHAYREFLAANGLEDTLRAALEGQVPDDPALLEGISAKIRAEFAAAGMPPELKDELCAAYARLGRPAVAVRSSATAEDLPEMSFAGQQDTFLNVAGDEALLKAVVECWSSLWTARAIGYRTRNGVPQAGIALAVVVQRMVESQASGVLFTANPLTGLRSETVIDATLGLGEALVSGQVEPDHYVVDTARGEITTRRLGAKAISIHGQAGGGTQVVENDARQIQALPDASILALAQMGQRVAALYGSPQDIEWAWAGDTLYLLQARAITSLYPLPAGMAPEPLKVMFSFGAVQGMLAPVTPMGQDMLFEIFAYGAHLFGIPVTRQTQTVLYAAGERLWINFTTVLRNSTGRNVTRFALKLVEPTVLQALASLWEDPRLRPGRKALSLRAASQLARFFVPLAGNLILNLLAPNSRRQKIVDQGEKVLSIMRERSRQLQGGPRERLAQLLELWTELIGKHLPHTFILFISGVASGMASLNLLNTLAKGLSGEQSPQADHGWEDLVLEITRGVPYNPTTEMDLTLWQTAQAVRNDPPSWEEFNRHSVRELAARYRAGALPPAAQHAFDQFLARYGGRGLGEIDAGRPRWIEDPTHVFDVVAGYLRLENWEQAPDAVFARSAESARAAVDRLAAAARQSRGGWLKARQVRFAASRARALLGTRESPKFFAVRLMGVFRQELLKIGAELVDAGELAQADDLVYLTLSEMQALAGGEEKDWPGLIAHRREAYQREQQRRQIPRLLLSDGRAFYEGLNEPADTLDALVGSPVSPGAVEGKVRIVLDPRHAHLQPGEILVCPGTDPSWTPLFLTAAGLVMEVGGMMTHGAVVAREYGIPAIVGVDQATRRLHTGQRVRVNGSTGQIALLDDPE